MKTMFFFRVIITVSVLTLIASSIGFILIGGQMLLSITKVSFIAFGLSALTCGAIVLIGEYRRPAN